MRYKPDAGQSEEQSGGAAARARSAFRVQAVAAWPPAVWALPPWVAVPLARLSPAPALPPAEAQLEFAVAAASRYVVPVGVAA